MQQLVILLVISCSLTCSGRPYCHRVTTQLQLTNISSGDQTAFSLPMVFCPVVTTVTTGQKTIGSENSV